MNNREHDLRPGERAVAAPAPTDASLTFVGVIRTPWTDRAQCPRQGSPDGPVCVIEVFPPWVEALDGVDGRERLEVLYWLHESRRDLVAQSPRGGVVRGTFSIRSPVRPNPIGTAIVRLVRLEGAILHVRGLDCLDGTPLLDLKPDRSLFGAPAPDETSSGR